MSSNKPFPSSDLDVFKENSLILDNFVNSQENEHPDRFNRKRPTITGIIKEAFNVRTDISNMNETLIGQSRWDVVPKNTSLSLGGDNGALNKQAQALFNRTIMLKVHAREALRRSYLETGYNLVEGSFEQGGKLVNSNDVLLQERTGKAFSGPAGTVAAGTNPASVGFVDKSGSVQDFIDAIRVISGSTYRSVEEMTQSTSDAVGNTVSSGRTIWLKVGEQQTISSYKPMSTIHADDFGNILDAVDVAAEHNLREIAISAKNYKLTTRHPYLSEVLFVGNGTLSGSGAYRTRICSDSAKKSIVQEQTIPYSALRNFSTKKNPVVVIVGDSLTTVQPDSLDQTTTLNTLLRDALRDANPAKNITWYNRGIGGQTFTSFNTKPSVFPAGWYTDTSKNWIDYIEALEPDLVFVGFGMNDGHNDGFNAASAKSALLKLRSFTKPCDVVLITTPVPTMSATDTYADYSTEKSQHGRDRVAGYVRTYAAKYGLGLIDANRMSNAVRDGFDVTSTDVKRDSVSVSNGAAKLSTKCVGFSMQLKMLATAFTTAGRTLSVKIGPDRLDVVHITSVNEKLVFTFYSSSGGADSTITSNFPTPTGEWNLLVERRGNRFYAAIAGSSSVDDALSTDVIVGGGLFVPSVGWFQTDYLDGPVNWSFFGNAHVYTSVVPTATDSMLWGKFDPANTSLKLPFGGNGLNHPSSIGVDRFYGDAIKAVDFSAVSSGSVSAQKLPENTIVTSGVLTAVPVFGANEFVFDQAGVYSIFVKMNASTGMTDGEILLKKGPDSTGTTLARGRVINSSGYFELQYSAAFSVAVSVSVWVKHSTGADLTLVASASTSVVAQLGRVV